MNSVNVINTFFRGSLKVPVEFLEASLKQFLLAGLLLFGMPSPGFTEPCAPSQPFSNVLSFDRKANGQIISQHDCDRDGSADYQTIWTVVEFAGFPLACRDPYDARHLILPRSGFYRIVAEPVRVVILPEKEERLPREFRSFRKGGQW